MIRVIKNLIHQITIILLIFVICCIIIPTIYFMNSVYSYSSDWFEKTLIKNIQIETAGYAELLKQEFYSIHQQTFKMLTDGVANHLLVKFELDQYDTRMALQLQQLQAQMKMIKYCHRVVDDIFIFYPMNKRMITVNSQQTYNASDGDIKSIIQDSEGENLWNDSDGIIIWSGNGSGDMKEYSDFKVIALSRITKKTLDNYLNLYSTNTDAIWAVYTSNKIGNEFFVTTDTMFDIEYLPEKIQPGEYVRITINAKEYLLTIEKIQENMMFFQILPFDHVSIMLNEYKEMLFLFTGILVCFSLFFVLLFYFIIHKPIEHARYTFIRMGNGELGVQMEKSWYTEFQEMYDQFNSMSKNIQYLVEQEYQLRLLNTKAQMKQLQYQISPHFLYNTYFTLCGLLQDMDYECAEKMADIMGRYLKYITVTGNDMANLEEEIEHARIYAEIQKIRFSNRISIYFEDYSDELKFRKVPRLIIQPLIENAFVHGVKERLEGGIILVNVAEKQGIIKICVQDNGIELTDMKLNEINELVQNKKDNTKESVALFNIHKRLSMLYGTGSGLFFSRSSLGGLCCELIIGIEKGE